MQVQLFTIMVFVILLITVFLYLKQLISIFSENVFHLCLRISYLILNQMNGMQNLLYNNIYFYGLQICKIFSINLRSNKKMSKYLDNLKKWHFFLPFLFKILTLTKIIYPLGSFLIGSSIRSVNKLLQVCWKMYICFSKSFLSNVFHRYF